MKEFTTLQLFSVVDGRLSTNMNDVVDILSTALGRSLFTHELPAAMDEIKALRPDWYKEAEKRIEFAKRFCKNDFNATLEHLKHDFAPITVKQI